MVISIPSEKRCLGGIQPMGPDPGDVSHPVWVAAVGLASHLDANICGDEGETYDLHRGVVVASESVISEVINVFCLHSASQTALSLIHI